jgi:PAS domain S-box-containing protein
MFSKSLMEIPSGEARYKSLIEASPDGISINDFENIFYINKSGAKITGEKSDTLINKPFIQYIHPRDIDKLKDVILRLNKGEKVSRFEMTVVRKDGSERIIETRGVSTIHDGKPAILTFLRDRTERIKVDSEVKANRTNLAEAQKMAKIGSFQYNLKSDKVVWSEALYNIYGLDQKTYKPTNKKFLNKVVHPDDRQYVKEFVDNAAKNNLSNYHYSLLHYQQILLHIAYHQDEQLHLGIYYLLAYMFFGLSHKYYIMLQTRQLYR